jgi:hypothetical protein
MVACLPSPLTPLPASGEGKRMRSLLPWVGEGLGDERVILGEGLGEGDADQEKSFDWRRLELRKALVPLGFWLTVRRRLASMGRDEFLSQALKGAGFRISLASVTSTLLFRLND